MNCPHCGQKMSRTTFKVRAGYYNETQDFYEDAMTMAEASEAALVKARKFVHPKSEVLSCQIA